MGRLMMVIDRGDLTYACEEYGGASKESNSVFGMRASGDCL